MGYIGSITRDGVTYRIVESVKVTSGKNFGKTLYRLESPTGQMFSAMCKGPLKANTRLTPHSI